MKRIVISAAAAMLLAGTASAANLVVTAAMGENLATFSKTDDDNDDNDGIRFFDHYADNSQAWAHDGLSYVSSNVSLTGESAIGGAQLEFKYGDKKFSNYLMNGWINVNNFLFTGKMATLKFGRFNALPAVDFVGDATRGYHFNSYGAQYQAGFDPQTMAWFLKKQGFTRGAHTVLSSYSAWEKPNAGGTIDGKLSSYNWFFNDANNAGASLGYDSNYFGVTRSFMVQLNLSEDLFVRFVMKSGSADAAAGTVAHDFYGEKTFTNWNAQVSYTIPDIVKLGLTVKMSDQFSGVYYDANDLYESAGTDLNVAFAASSDSLVDGLRLYAGYTFAGVYMGMKNDVNGKTDLSETYMFHAVDLRAVYDVDEQLSVGLLGNVSMVNQSEYAKEADSNLKDYMGFNVGLSASYALSDVLAIDCTAGFRCLNTNNEDGIDRDNTSKTTEGDMLSASSIGIEPSLVFTFNKNCALSIGLNVLIQNLNSNVNMEVWQNNRMDSTSANVVYPFNTTVTLPLYMFIRI